MKKDRPKHKHTRTQSQIKLQSGDWSIEKLANVNESHVDGVTPCEETNQYDNRNDTQRQQEKFIYLNHLEYEQWKGILQSEIHDCFNEIIKQYSAQTGSNNTSLYSNYPYLPLHLLSIYSPPLHTSPPICIPRFVEVRSPILTKDQTPQPHYCIQTHFTFIPSLSHAKFVLSQLKNIFPSFVYAYVLNDTLSGGGQLLNDYANINMDRIINKQHNLSKELNDMLLKYNCSYTLAIISVSTNDDKKMNRKVPDWKRPFYYSQFEKDELESKYVIQRSLNSAKHFIIRYRELAMELTDEMQKEHLKHHREASNFYKNKTSSSKMEYGHFTLLSLLYDLKLHPNTGPLEE